MFIEANTQAYDFYEKMRYLKLHFQLLTCLTVKFRFEVDPTSPDHPDQHEDEGEHDTVDYHIMSKIL